MRRRYVWAAVMVGCLLLAACFVPFMGEPDVPESLMRDQGRMTSYYLDAKETGGTQDAVQLTVMMPHGPVGDCPVYVALRNRGWTAKPPAAAGDEYLLLPPKGTRGNEVIFFPSASGNAVIYIRSPRFAERIGHRLRLALGYSQ